ASQGSELQMLGTLAFKNVVRPWPVVHGAPARFATETTPGMMFGASSGVDKRPAAGEFATAGSSGSVVVCVLKSAATSTVLRAWPAASRNAIAGACAFHT